MGVRVRVYMCAHTCSQGWHQSPGRDCQPNDFHLHWWQMAVAWTSTDWKQMKSGPSSPALHLITQHMLEITPKRIWGTLVDLQHEKSSFSSVSFCLIQFAQIIDVVGGRARRRARLICSAWLTKGFPVARRGEKSRSLILAAGLQRHSWSASY